MEETNDGSGRFSEVTLKPRVEIALVRLSGNLEPRFFQEPGVLTPQLLLTE